jgi:hypothetical protein
MKSGSNPMSRRNNIVIQELGGEILVYDLRTNRAFCLNETSAMVWQSCDGKKTVSDISRAVTEKLKSNISEDIVWLALNQFKKDNLLADNDDFVTPFDGMNRRQIVKRIGFASIVALPLISAVVAPTALHAQSANNCGPIGQCDGSAVICTCIPVGAPGGNSNLNPDLCPCVQPGNCSGSCRCGSPCTLQPCPPGESCSLGFCTNGAPCNGNCPSGQSCNPDGSCSGVCPPSSFNFCAGGILTGICTDPFDNNSNLSAPCCTCNTDGDCMGSCSNNNAPGTTGVCV